VDGRVASDIPRFLTTDAGAIAFRDRAMPVGQVKARFIDADHAGRSCMRMT
jgi:hypothetical protein